MIVVKQEGVHIHSLCAFHIGGDIIDEETFFRLQPVSVQKDLKDLRIGFDAFLKGGDDDAVEVFASRDSVPVDLFCYSVKMFGEHFGRLFIEFLFIDQTDIVILPVFRKQKFLEQQFLIFFIIGVSADQFFRNEPDQDIAQVKYQILQHISG